MAAAAAPLFLDPSSFDMLVHDTPLEIPMNHNGESEILSYPIIIVPEGTVVHRADRGGATVPSGNMPAFFGNRESIKVYAGAAGNAAYSSYRVAKPLRLFNMGMNSLRDLMLHPEVSDEQYDLLRKYFNLQKGLVFPTLITAKENIQGNYVDYLNRKIARILCGLGFDGWIVMPFSVEKRRGLVQFVMSQKKAIPYMPEIMVCRWKEHLEHIPAVVRVGGVGSGGGSGRKTRRRRSNLRGRATRRNE